MASKRFKIEKAPGMHTTQGVDRELANVEAEKGETMLTTDGVSNEKLLVGIGGKKHSEGGTPLNAAEGTAIFSDNLKIKDPMILKFFNEKGKKPKTFAEISKKYDVTDDQEDLADEEIDHITRASLEKNIDNSAFKLSALFTMQEFHEKKGSPEEHSKHFEPFMERMGIDYENIFGSPEQAQQEQQVEQVKEGSPQEPQSYKDGGKVKYGNRIKNNGDVVFTKVVKDGNGGFKRIRTVTRDGEVIKRNVIAGEGSIASASDPTSYAQFRYGGNVELPKADWGDQIKMAPPYGESSAYTKEGIERLNKYLKGFDLKELSLDATPSIIRMKVKEAQKAAITRDPELIFDYMTTDDEGTSKSHRPNDKLQKIMTTQKGTHSPTGKDGSWTNEDLRLMLKDKSINVDHISDAYQDGKWWYRMVNSDITEVSKLEMDKLTATEQYKNAPIQNGLRYIHQGDGYYKAYKTKEDGTVIEVEADKAVVDELYKWDIDPMEVTPETERNMDFLWSNKRALNQARKNKRNIQYLEPFTATPDTSYTQQAYYNPDQAINAMQSMVNTQGTKNAMFAPQQQQTANFLAGQQFDMMSKIIGQYDDKNVAAYNREQMTNTQIANRASERLAGAITGHHDKTTVLKQNFANAMTAADNNIAENEIAMWQERADRLNLEATIGEQYAKDPNTGIHEFQKGKDYGPTNAAGKTVMDTYNEYMDLAPPGTDPAVIASLAKAHHSGKYDVQPMPVPTGT